MRGAVASATSIFGSLLAEAMLRDAGPTFKNSFVPGGDVIPEVSLPDTGLCTILPYGVSRRNVQNARQEAREGLRPPDVERQGGASRDLLILRRRVVADHAPVSQGLHQGRMGPPDFRGLDVN